MKEITTAIAKVMGAVGYVQKKGENKFHGYKFAAIGDILAKIQPAMAEAGLVITQSETCHELIDNGTVMTATYEFALGHVSGESWPDRPRHTGMAAARNSKGGFDDKALNKCHTAARKYFLMGLFQIPTGDVADPDEDDSPPPKNGNGNGLHEPLPQEAAKRPAPGKPEDEAKKWVAREALVLAECKTTDDLRRWEAKNDGHLQRLNKVDRDLFDNIMGILSDRYEKIAPAQMSA